MADDGHLDLAQGRGLIEFIVFAHADDYTREGLIFRKFAHTRAEPNPSMPE
ncbi:hypothetical protein LP420_22960 [Massilia sp. B-10]|nr:hypothetical protein LP420_22960 [Massilia sp. B-10]UUZ52325.1 hypothetical protein LP419_22405 [Massilia sp. H-1]